MNLTMVDPGTDVISNVCKAVKCVVVIISGRPIVIEPYMTLIDALVAAWLPGTEGQGLTDVLFGDYGFSGKLSRTWFKSVDQLPMNVGDSHYDPLFPFGFGLTTETVMARYGSINLTEFLYSLLLHGIFEDPLWFSFHSCILREFLLFLVRNEIRYVLSYSVL